MNPYIIIILFLFILAISFAAYKYTKLVAEYNKRHFILTPNKYLVFTSAGDRNNIDSWTSVPHKKNFDLVVYYYGENDTPDIKADLIIKRKGFKLDNFHHFITHYDIGKYESIWVVDDDIILNTGQIRLMFNLFTEYELWLAQPSFHTESVISHPITIHHPEYVLRYTNFVEVGVPIFSTKIIPVLKDTFKAAKSGYGIDFIWTSLLGFPKDKIAVLDSIICKHINTNRSALDNIMPRSSHVQEGVETLKKYHLLPSKFQIDIKTPHPKPFYILEYSNIPRKNWHTNSED